MIEFDSTLLDTAPIWTFMVLLVRFGGVFEALPGIGGDEFGPQFRYFAIILISLSLVIAGVRAPEVDGVLQIALVLGSELLLGYALGSIPTLVLAGLSVGGQVIAGAIGLGQANLIDRSLGGSVSVLSRLKVMLATVVFLSVNGHHVIIKLASGQPGGLALSIFRPDMNTALVLSEQLSRSFELALSVSAPILVTTLVVQFVLGLITKFVPQVNIFIISLPLTLMVGLFLFAFALPGVINQSVEAFAEAAEVAGRLFENSVPDGQNL